MGQLFSFREIKRNEMAANPCSPEWNWNAMKAPILRHRYEALHIDSQHT